MFLKSTKHFSGLKSFKMNLNKQRRTFLKGSPKKGTLIRRKHKWIRPMFVVLKGKARFKSVILDTGTIDISTFNLKWADVQLVKIV